MTDIQKLKGEITGDPEKIGFASMTDDEVVAAIHLKNRPVPIRPIPGALFNYIGFTKHTTGQAGDSETFIYGRLVRAAKASDAELLFGNASALNQVQIDACVTLLAAIDQSRAETIKAEQTVAAVELLTVVESTGVMGSDDNAALQALFLGMQSRAEELNLGDVRAGTVAEARRA